MTEPATEAVDAATEAPEELAEIVEWTADDGNRHRGSRFGSGYVEYCNRWLAAERTFKAEEAVKADAAEESGTATTTEPNLAAGGELSDPEKTGGEKADGEKTSDATDPVPDPSPETVAEAESKPPRIGSSRRRP